MKLASEISSAQVPSRGISLWFLGQNSFVLKGSDGFSVAIDPYLSDWCATRGKSSKPTPKSRLFPPPLKAEDLSVDMVLLTHSHCDHADPETLAVLAAKPHIRVAGPREAMQVAYKAGFPSERIRTLTAGEEVCFYHKPGILAAVEQLHGKKTDTGITIKASFALPTDSSDLNHLGFLIRFAGGVTFWDTGDTAWSEMLPELAADPVVETVQKWREGKKTSHNGPDLMAVCINAGYGNLSHWEAAKLAARAEARYVIPTHWDLFPHNSLDPEPFRNSLSKKAPESRYSLLERGCRYNYSQGKLYRRQEN